MLNANWTNLHEALLPCSNSTLSAVNLVAPQHMACCETSSIVYAPLVILSLIFIPPPGMVYIWHGKTLSWVEFVVWHMASVCHIETSLFFHKCKPPQSKCFCIAIVVYYESSALHVPILDLHQQRKPGKCCTVAFEGQHYWWKMEYIYKVLVGCGFQMQVLAGYIR